MQKVRGITLIELLVAMGIVAILASLAGPPFVRLIKSNTMSSTVNTFLADMRYARSEAVRRGGRVTLCRSEAPEDVPPTCATTTPAGSKGWATGWVVFHDRDADDAFSAGDEPLRVQAAMESIDAILEGTAADSTVFRFTATGRLADIGSAATMNFGGSNFDTPLKRVVCVSAGGRARVAGDGSATCGASDE